MRFTATTFVSLAIAFMGVQAMPAPDGSKSSSVVPIPTDKYKHPEPTDKYKHPEPTDKYKHPEPTKEAKHEPAPHKPDDKEHEPEYELVCQKFAFFHNWDITCGDLECGPTKGKYVYDCAKDCLENEDCDATVSFDGYCYPKTLDYFQAFNLIKSHGRDLAIEGCCEDLQEKHKKENCYPDGFLDCCYDKEICVKVYKDGKKHEEEPKKEEPKKDDRKKEEPKKEEPKKDDHKKEEPKKEEPKKEEKKW